MRSPKHLEKLRDEAQALGMSAQITTNETRLILNLLTRTLETLVDGEPKTKPVTRHHT